MHSTTDRVLFIEIANKLWTQNTRNNRRLLLTAIILCLIITNMYYWHTRTMISDFKSFNIRKSGNSRSTKYRLIFEPMGSSLDFMEWVPRDLTSFFSSAQWSLEQIERFARILREKYFYRQISNATISSMDESQAHLSILMHSDTSAMLKEEYIFPMAKYMSLGKMPAAVHQSDESNKTFENSGANYSIPEIYFHADHRMRRYKRKNCSMMSFDRRKFLYESLKEWKSLAASHNILWWISYGTLLGSLRNQYIIPYDHDLDISVLGSQETLIRRLETPRTNFSFGKFNMFTRPGNYCDSKPRVDCSGKPVRMQTDECSFCWPLARIFQRYTEFVDIFLVHIEVRTDIFGQSIDYGFLDEGAKHDAERLYDVNILFPLKSCQMMGLTVPCPNQSEKWLQIVYGDGFRKPRYRCNSNNGKWM